MRSRPFQPTLQWQGQKFGQQPGLHHTRSHAQRLLVSPLPHPSMALHRQVLVGNLFKHANEIQRIDDGYALRFYRSSNPEELIGIIAEYVIFESLNVPQLLFSIVEEPQEKAFWLQVRSLVRNERDATSACIATDPPGSFFV